MFLEILVLALVAGTDAAGLCPNTTGRILVQMPQLDQSMFSYKIQINVPDAEKTLDAFEYYDHVNKSIFLYLDQTNMGKRTMQRVMYDYKYNQTFNVNELTNTCSVKDLTSPNDQITLFGAGVENGPDGVNNSFFWNAGYNSTYEGNATIDGVLTDHYQTCLTFENDTVTYLIDVFFSAINWSMPAAQRAPVKLTLNASTTVNNVTTSRMYFYKFSDYHTMATPDDWKPERPSGMICPGRKDAPTISPMDMKQLSLKYEIYTMTSEDRISTSKLFEYQDEVNNMFRMDFYSKGKEMKLIHDFNQGLSFNESLITGVCQITPISLNDSFIDAKVSPGNPHLVHMKPLSWILNVTYPVYGGVGKFKGIPAHLWIGTKPLVMEIKGVQSSTWQTTYMSVAKLNGKSSVIGVEQKTFTQLQTTNITTHQRLFAYEFETSIQDLSVFDVSFCYNASMKNTIVIKFPGEHYPDVLMNFPAFQKSLVAQAAAKANVSFYRVASQVRVSTAVELDSDSKNVTRMFAWVTLLGVPAVKGDSDTMVPQISLKQATSNLFAAIADNFQVQFPSTPTNNVTLTAFRDFVKTDQDLFTTPNCPAPKPQPQNGGITTGAVVGIAFAMVVVGMLMGCFVVHWRTRKRQYAYTMQD